jgi:hypothetical protein
MDTNKEALLDELWRICAICSNGNIPAEAEIELERFSMMLDNFKAGKFITYGLGNNQDTD